MKRKSAPGNPFLANPVLTVHLPIWRSKLILFLIFTAFFALIARAFWIQGPGNAFYQRQGENRYERILELPATRGRIFDRNGHILATSLPVKAIWAIPEDVHTPLPKKQLQALSRLLDINISELQRKLDQDKKFVYLKHQVPPAIAQEIQKLDIEGIYDRPEYKRFYPEGEVTAHTVGFTNIEDIGQEGIELAREDDLKGSPGRRRVIKDRLGRIVDDVDILATPRNGEDLTLSIDNQIQFIAYSELKKAVQQNKAKAGSAIVLDAHNGEILALVNLPTYNPNDRKDLKGPELRNRALVDVFEPGSIMKPFTVATALRLNRVTPDTLIATAPGKLFFNGATITDTHDYGTLTVSGVIQKSSNIGATKIALRMQAKEMWDMLTELGFGQVPQIGFPGAVTGRLRSYKNWRPIEQATIGYGYGISASLLQLAHAYTVFAHDGKLLPISIYKTGQATLDGVQVISPEIASEIRKMLALVVQPGGTSIEAQVPGYSVGGKTGTAYKQSGRGYDRNKYRASFVGIAPIFNPRVVIAITVDEPSAGAHYGGVVAGPVFSKIAGSTLRVLNIAPDLPIKQNTQTNTAQQNKNTMQLASLIKNEKKQGGKWE